MVELSWFEKAKTLNRPVIDGDGKRKIYKTDIIVWHREMVNTKGKDVRKACDYPEISEMNEDGSFNKIYYKMPLMDRAEREEMEEISRKSYEIPEYARIDEDVLTGKTELEDKDICICEEHRSYWLEHDAYGRFNRFERKTEPFIDIAKSVIANHTYEQMSVQLLKTIEYEISSRASMMLCKPVNGKITAYGSTDGKVEISIGIDDDYFVSLETIV